MFIQYPFLGHIYFRSKTLRSQKDFYGLIYCICWSNRPTTCKNCRDNYIYTQVNIVLSCYYFVILCYHRNVLPFYILSFQNKAIENIFILKDGMRTGRVDHWWLLSFFTMWFQYDWDQIMHLCHCSLTYLYSVINLDGNCKSGNDVTVTWLPSGRKRNQDAVVLQVVS